MPRLATPLSVLAIAGASVALVACGSSDSGGGSASTNASGGNGANQNAAFEKYRQCLKDNGVTLPDRGQGNGNGNGGPGGDGGYGPPPGAGAGASTNGTPPSGDGAGAPPQGGGFPGGGQMDAKTQKAMQACAKLRPQFRGGPNGNNGGQRPQQNIKAFTPYLNCLKSEGLSIKVSDGFNALRNLKQDDPKVQAAFKTCQSKLPQRPSSTQPPTTTSGSTT
jgi:hypothetical protein